MPSKGKGFGKVYMMRAGLFDDVGVLFHRHPVDRNSPNASSALANNSSTFKFTRISAHAAAAIDRAISSLDAVESINCMASFVESISDDPEENGEDAEYMAMMTRYKNCE